MPNTKRTSAAMRFTEWGWSFHTWKADLLFIILMTIIIVYSYLIYSDIRENKCSVNNSSDIVMQMTYVNILVFITTLSFVYFKVFPHIKFQKKAHPSDFVGLNIIEDEKLK